MSHIEKDIIGKNDINLYETFLSKYMEKDDTQIISITNIYTLFNKWFKLNKHNYKYDKPSRIEMRLYLNKYYSEYKKNNGWNLGFKFLL
tara:strand:- start:670 stop:936 length:267 start_codon:yes stop_codon:yes gene_type:complete